MATAIAHSVLFVSSVLLGSVAYGLGLGNLSQPQPGFFPFWTSVGLGLASASQLVQVFRMRVRQGPDDSEVSPFSLGAFRRISIIMVAAALYGVLLGTLGFLITTLLFLGFFWLAFDRQTLWRGLLLTAVSATGAYILFAKLLNVHFPRGPFGF